MVGMIQRALEATRVGGAVVHGGVRQTQGDEVVNGDDIPDAPGIDRQGAGPVHDGGRRSSSFKRNRRQNTVFVERPVGQTEEVRTGPELVGGRLTAAGR
ncbi:hypothetical protein D3C80_1371100 [compost metagenome]